MTTGLDFTPGSGPAPRGARIRAHARLEASLTARNGEQLLLALVIPLGLLVAWRFLVPSGLLDPETFPASVLALAVWSTGFTSLAITTAFELRYGVLERLAATPLTRGDLVLGKAAATAAIALVQVLVLAAAALVLGWRPGGAGAASFGWGGVAGVGGLALAIVGAVLALIVFASWALIIGSRLRAELVLAVANLVYLAGAAFGGIVVPSPAWWLPTAALGDLLRGTAVGWTPLWPLAILACWAAGSALIARKVFRWVS